MTQISISAEGFRLRLTHTVESPRGLGRPGKTIKTEVFEINPWDRHVVRLHNGTLVIEEIREAPGAAFPDLIPPSYSFGLALDDVGSGA